MVDQADGVQLATLKRHCQQWWPRDRDAIAATYALLDPAVGAELPPIATRVNQKPNVIRTA
jgi:hypothetical protein